MAILDHNGRPYVPDAYTNGRNRLGSELDPPPDEFALPHVLTFAGLMNSAYRLYYQRYYDEARRKDPFFALMMRNDCFLMGLMQERTLAVVSQPWYIEVEDEHDERQVMVRDHITKAVKRGPRFREMLFNLEHDGTWYGRTGVQLRYHWVILNSIKTLQVRQWMPVMGDKITHTWDHVPVINVYGGAAADMKNAEVVSTDLYQGIVLRGTWRERFLIHKHHQWDSDFLDGMFAAEAVHGNGIRSALHWWQWVRCEWLAKVSDYMDRVGLGVNIWYYELGNAASESAVKTVAVEQSGKVNLILPRSNLNKSQGFERVETPIAGADAIGRITEAIEEWQRIYVVGQTLSSTSKESGGLGGAGKSELQGETKNLIAAHDAHNLAETLTGSSYEFGLVHYLQRWTFPDTLPDKPNGFPLFFRFGEPRERGGERMDEIEKASKLVPVKVDDVYKAASLTKPTEQDEVVGGYQPDVDEEGNPIGGDEQGKPGEGNPDESKPAGKEKEDKPGKFAMEGKGHWVTLNNDTHVFIGRGGYITKGPRDLTGRKPNELGDHKITAEHGSQHPEIKNIKSLLESGEHDKALERYQDLPFEEARKLFQSLKPNQRDQLSKGRAKEEKDEATVINEAGKKLTDWQGFPYDPNTGSGVYIADLYDHLKPKGSLEEFKQKVFKLFQEGKIQLERSDLPHKSKSHEQDRRSAISHPSGFGEYHLVKILGKISKRTPADKNKADKFEMTEKGHWVTLENKTGGGGVHVFIGKGGHITKGPKDLRGKKPDELGDHKITAVHGAEHPEADEKEEEAERKWAAKVPKVRAQIDPEIAEKIIGALDNLYRPKPKRPEKGWDYLGDGFVKVQDLRKHLEEQGVSWDETVKTINRMIFVGDLKQASVGRNEESGLVQDYYQLPEFDTSGTPQERDE